MENEDEQKNKTPILKPVTFIVPVCCREGHDNCPHKVQKPIKKKRNVGL